MIQNSGLAILAAWLMFAALLVVLAVILLHGHRDVMSEVRRRADGSPEPGPPTDE